MDLDLVITGGTLLTAGDNFRADLGILDGVISAIGEGLSGRETIDARGKLVIPGGVDPHVHLEMPVGPTVSCDDWETGTIAAAFGGTTTVIDFIEPEDDQTLLQAFEERRSKADYRANIDFGLHMTLI
ncbi:MAG: amidohydrolase family protein, partial [Chloroflexota bacterium]|nr:amidohydrolase family protein [Chloroflexota bacterium]